MNDKEKKHARTKLILRIAGCCMILAGLALAVTGLMSLFSADEEAPDLFWMAMIGFPVLVVGIFLLLVSFQRAIASYAKNEAVPVVNEAAEEVAPAVQAIAGAAREGLEEGAACPACGTKNDAGAKFCDNCGQPLCRICPACGEKNDAAAKFCDNCGGKL